MCIWIVGGRVPVTGMLAGMNLSKPGMNLSKPGMNLSKPGKKHNNHVIILNKQLIQPIEYPCFLILLVQIRLFRKTMVCHTIMVLIYSYRWMEFKFPSIFLATVPFPGLSAFTNFRQSIHSDKRLYSSRPITCESSYLEHWLTANRELKGIAIFVAKLHSTAYSCIQHK